MSWGLQKGTVQASCRNKSLLRHRPASVPFPQPEPQLLLDAALHLEGSSSQQPRGLLKIQNHTAASAPPPPTHAPSRTQLLCSPLSHPDSRVPCGLPAPLCFWLPIAHPFSAMPTSTIPGTHLAHAHLWAFAPAILHILAGLVYSPPCGSLSRRPFLAPLFKATCSAPPSPLPPPVEFHHYSVPDTVMCLSSPSPDWAMQKVRLGLSPPCPCIPDTLVSHRHFWGKKVGTRDTPGAPGWVPHWLHLCSAGLWAESLPPSSDRCVNFPSREAQASGDEFLGPFGDIFLWNKERETLGRSCSCHCSLGDIVGGLGLGKGPDLCEIAGLGVECTVSPSPRGTGAKPHGRRVGQ